MTAHEYTVPFQLRGHGENHEDLYVGHSSTSQRTAITSQLLA